jgi:O-antigen ligase
MSVCSDEALLDRRIFQSSAESDFDTASSELSIGRVGMLDLLLVTAIAICWCGYVPILFSWFWTPRIAVALVASVPGLIALVVLAVRGQRASRLALGVIAWAFVAAVASDNARLALLGAAGQESHVLAYVAAFGLWALAQFMTTTGRRLLYIVLLVTVAVNAVFGLLQVLLQIDGVDLGLTDGRAVGLTPNPIFLASIMLVGIFALLSRIDVASASAVRWSLGALTLFGAALASTATRVALIAFVAVCFGVVVSRWHPRRAVGVAMTACGVVAGTALARLVGNHNDALSRSTTVQAAGRIDWWIGGLRAVAERPVLGWGPGRFRSALQGDFSFASIAAAGDNQSMPDAHNLVVTTLVAIGVPGFLLLAAFAYTVSRRARGIYCSALTAVLIVWLLQPAGLVMLFPFMLLLGVSMPTTRNHPAAGRFDCDVGDQQLPRAVWVWAGATAIGVVAASWLLVADYRLANAALDSDGAAFAATEWMFLDDPIISDVGATIWIRNSFVEEEAGRQVIPQLERTVMLEPTRPYWHARLARAYAAKGDYGNSVASARRALELQPTSAQAWTTLLLVAERTDDDRLFAESMEAVCLLDLDECAPGQ